MLWLLAAGLAVGTLLVWWLRQANASIRLIADTLGFLSFFALFAIGAESVLETLLHDTVFMTEVHQFLLNPLFLASGGYLGPYLLAMMAETLRKPSRNA